MRKKKQEVKHLRVECLELTIEVLVRRVARKVLLEDGKAWLELGDLGIDI